MEPMFMLFYYFYFDRYNRAEIIQSLAWTTIRHDHLPDEIVKKLSSSENVYLKNYSANLKFYMSDSIDLDLSVVSSPIFHAPECLLRDVHRIKFELITSNQRFMQT